ncbi:hypothetical protein BYT27DRAFT_6391443 [Phlegmacium glaucopus]|nr:hypothetical protein BYT27DRAFT_6391443 [Phlegmacium glaucopus]
MPLYDFSQDFYPTYSVQLPASNFDDEDEDEDMLDATNAADHPTSPIPTYVYGPDKSHPIAQIPKTVRSATLDGLKGTLRVSGGSSSKNSKVKKPQTNPSISPNTRRREKAYRCPTPRCTKSYLNPNGLKYHLEKGTCKIETEDESEVGEESTNLLPAAPITTSSPASMPTSPHRPEVQAVTEVGSYDHQQPATQHIYQDGGVHRHESEESLARQTHRHHQQPYQYPYQYPATTAGAHRSLYPGQLPTPPSYSPTIPITVSSHDQ